MRLIDCYIENFGMLSGYSRAFTEGVNTVYADNGEGKTTLSVFIKSMLYGLDDTKARSIEDNERKMYLPWQGGGFGGYLTFEYDGHIYRVERTFGKKASDDTVKVVDTVTGERVPKFESRLGEIIFGIDRVGFEATVFLSEKNISLNETNSATVQQKLSDVVGADGATDAYDKAIKMLEDESRILKNKRGGAGEIADTERFILECENAIRHIEDNMSAEKRIEAEIRAIESELGDLTDKRRVLSQDIDEERRRDGRRALALQYNTLVEKEEEAKGELERMLTFFKDGSRSEGEMSEIIGAQMEAEALTEQLKRSGSSELAELRDYFRRETGYAEIAEMESKQRSASDEAERVENIRKNTKEAAELLRREVGGEIPDENTLNDLAKRLSKKRTSPLTIISVIMGAVGLIAGAATLLFPDLILLSIIAFVLGGVLLATGIILMLRSGDKDAERVMKRLGLNSAEDVTSLALRIKEFYASVRQNEEKIAEAEKKIADLERELSNYLDCYPTEGVCYADRLREVRAKYEVYYDLKTRESVASKEIEMKELRLSYLNERVRSYLTRYPTTSESPIEEIRQTIATCRTLEDRVRMLGENREHFCQMNAITDEDIAEIVRESRVAGIEAEIQGVDEKIKSARERLVLKECELRDIVLVVDKYDEVVAKKNMLIEKRDEAIKRFNIITRTASLLREASETMTSRYIGKTRERFKHYEEVIGGDTGEFTITTRFKLSRLDRGATRDMESYSRGTKDLYALALRLALIDSLYTSEVPPIMLDDPFTAFDDKRLMGAKRALSEIGKERQIIYFTCASSRVI